MGNLVLTDHFKTQTASRFNKKPSQLVSWVNNILSEGVLLHNAGVGRYNKHRILSQYIFDEKRNIIIVVLPKNGIYVAVTSYKASECLWFVSYKKAIGKKIKTLSKANELFKLEETC